uniref:Hyaluronidase n=1 Tax=Conus magus TaxID=6492 RepID=A0A5P8I112_CONMA|nr:conohyaluronidase [Conus magus]
MRAVVVVTGLVVVVVATALSLPDHDVKSATSSRSSSDDQGSSGDDCDEGLPPPDQPFRVVWNHPDNCERIKLHLPLDEYGIIFNKLRVFLGEEIQTLYDTGPWPYISETGKFINGGLPQSFNHPDNDGETQRILKKHKPENFTGLGVLDFETWRAIYSTNFGPMAIYQNESVKLVKEKHPDYDQKKLTKVAEKEWQQAAKDIMSTKLKIAQEVMPRGHWGYYLYPRTWDNKRDTKFRNDKINWLWRQSTGLYPSIYIYDFSKKESAITKFVSDTVGEAVRVQKEFSPPNTPIYPYVMFQTMDNIFHYEDHLKISLGLSAKMGAAGVVLWGTSKHYKESTRQWQCQQLQEHIRTVLGPLVKNVTQMMTDCSRAICEGHGRCVHNSHDVILGETESQRLSDLCSTRQSRFRDYHCRCYSAWEGACCQTLRPSRCQKREQRNVHGGGDLID